MATAPTPKPQDRVTYYVHDDRIKFLGSGADRVNVVDNAKGYEGFRTVTMQRGVAQYFIDQGAIGDKPIEDMSKRATQVTAQVTGAGADVIEEKEKPKKGK